MRLISQLDLRIIFSLTFHLCFLRAPPRKIPPSPYSHRVVGGHARSETPNELFVSMSMVAGGPKEMVNPLEKRTGLH